MFRRIDLGEQIRTLQFLLKGLHHPFILEQQQHRCLCDEVKNKSTLRAAATPASLAQLRNYCTIKDIGGTTSRQTETVEDQDSLTQQEDQESTDFSIKNILYDEASDDMMKELNSCGSYEKLLAVVTSRSNEMDLKHWVQSTVCLWDLYNHSAEEQPSDELVMKICDGLRPHIYALNDNETGCCLLYLKRIKAPDQQLLKDLTATAMLQLECTNIPLEALSRLAVALNESGSINEHLEQKFKHHLLHHIEKCDKAEDLRLLAICFLNQKSLRNMENLDVFKAKIQEFLENGTLNASNIKTITKIIFLLNLPKWSAINSQLIRNLFLTLHPSIDELSENDLKALCRIFQHHLEPASMEHPLKNIIKALYEKEPSVDTMACLIPFSGPLERETLIPTLKTFLTSEKEWQQRNSTGCFFNVIRGLKISNTKLCDYYWEGVLNILYKNLIHEEDEFRFLRHCHRYMHFNNNLGGTYRYLPLERKLSQMCMHMIEDHPDGVLPSNFARLASFVMAYGHTPYAWKKYPNTLLSKIINMAQKFSIDDIYFLSRGLHISAELRFRYHAPTTLIMQSSIIDNIIAQRINEFLQNDEPSSISNLNTIIRILGNRKNLKNSSTYQLALNKFREVDLSNLNSRSIRDLAYNFISTNHIEPRVLEAMFGYIEANHEHVLGETLEKVLSCSYNLGYYPKSESIFEYSAEILMRDFELMSGLSIVQACLALCYYKTIPEELINRVFCVNFIKRIEDEIQLCYSKATYPERVLNIVMQLNRTVCLDFPEVNVPWFQQNYIEAQLSKKPFIKNRFNSDVKKLLTALLEDETYFRCNHTTPYGYQIDFVIHFDRDRKLLPPPPAETTVLDRITKVAILLLRLDSFCENDLTKLRGPELLRIKHLEMMGYKVLHINEHDWNAKYMNAPGAKANYLKCLLQIST